MGVFLGSRSGGAPSSSPNLSLFQNNIYKVNVRDYSPGIYVVQTDNFKLYDGLTRSTYPC